MWLYSQFFGDFIDKAEITLKPKQRFWKSVSFFISNLKESFLSDKIVNIWFVCNRITFWIPFWNGSSVKSNWAAAGGDCFFFPWGNGFIACWARVITLQQWTKVSFFYQDLLPKFLLLRWKLTFKLLTFFDHFKRLLLEAILNHRKYFPDNCFS